MNWWWVASGMLMLAAGITAIYQKNYRQAIVSFSYMIASFAIAGAK